MDSHRPLTEALVAGVDGCRAGWVFVLAEPHALGLRLIAQGVSGCFRSLIDHLTEATRTAEVISVDMPVGFGERDSRQADVEARRFIGARRSSVFPPPPRSVLHAEGDYATLNALSKQVRAGLSRQTYNLMPRMREVDAVITPALQSRVRESHPEVSFCALKGDCLRHAKHTPEGKQERRALLSRVYGPSVRDWRPPRGAAMDDLYDAAVLAWTASRIARGDATTLPATPEYDARGLRMEIVY